ncbi:Oxidoreductase FAD-binding domain family protein [Leishmania donovani]|uniref:Oxidoreductase FAD-binding domain family protein n=1 Tax=Leishmania donovani TaxID=5661 RepID=A0A504WVG2_LEIDO|nr:Oxidoreductase FAD-binding domain family protein [Leishmania donovani]
MPPKPWEQQLTGSSMSHRRPAPGEEGSTFSDFEYHHQRRGGHDGAAGEQQRGPAASPRRWSFTLQDIPGAVQGMFNDVNKGYVTRVTAAVATAFGMSYAVYTLVLQPTQQRRPLAKRWSWCAPPVPITLVEKNREKGSSMFVYRFALPNSYDYAGYEPVSSVRMMSGNVRELSSLSRWYTPISHPDERGFIEFAIKDCDPGRMSARLRYLEPGDIVYLGRWMREFPYQPNTFKELGVVCTTSGASVALQLMNIMDKNKADDTKLSLLYCHHTATDIPFKDTFFKAYAERNKNRIQVSYNVLAGGRRRGSAAPIEPNMYVGNIDPETIAAALPPPVRIVEAGAGVGSGTASQLATYRPQLLICGPQSMLAFLCGRVSSFGNYGYWQGPFYRYSGFLKDMGYTRSQVYKFGIVAPLPLSSNGPIADGSIIMMLQEGHSDFVQILRINSCCPGWCMIQTLVVVFSTIYGVAFNGCNMAPPETRDTALALKRAFDSLLTQARLSRGLTLCSASSRYERTMGFAVAPSVTKGATSTLHQRRGRVMGQLYWSICVALTLMTLFLTELLLARSVLRPVVPTASVGHAGADQMKAGQRAVASSSSTSRPPASTEAAVGSRENDAAATAAGKRGGIDEEPLPPTAHVLWVNASPALASPDVMSSVHESASAPLHEQVADANRSAVTERNAAETTTNAETRIQDKEVRLLKRAAVGLYRLGTAQHVSFHEWLLVHSKVLEVAAQKSEEATVRAWWRVAPLMAKLAFALLHGVRLVVTEYVALHNLHAASIGRVDSANSNTSPSSNGNVVQSEITLAPQTLSKNACPDLPTNVVNQERSGTTEGVHAYRLQVCASQEWRQPEREAGLQFKLIAYVQKIRFPTTTSPSVVASVHKPISDALISSAATARNANATAGAEATATSEMPMQNGLHIALVSSQLGLGDAHAFQGSTFYRVFCQEWLQFALLPSPKAPAHGNAKLDAASEAEVAGLMVTLRKSPAQRESDWVAHLKAAQLHYREMAEPAVPRLSLSNAAGWSPYLNQYATLLFSENTAQLSRVAGTYLSFLPNVSYALQHIRRTMESKLASVSLKCTVERTRRFTSNTQWFLSYLGLRCVQHKSSCLGGLFESEKRTLQNMDRYLSTTGKWSRGEFRVCMSAGMYVSDPSNELL